MTLVFDLSFSVKKGEVFGFLGPNGAGKTTTIRHVLGLIKANSGSVSILNFDCWEDQKRIQEHIGYVPGEIAFPSDMNGANFIQYIAQMRKMQSMDKAQQLIEMFDIDVSIQLKRMSKGTKQKIAIVCAFMHNPEIIILDEPTSGLDPLMQAQFRKLIKQEQALGHTIVMSSHIFEEVEETADRIAIIKAGKLQSITNKKELQSYRNKTYKVTFTNKQDYDSLKHEHFEIIEYFEHDYAVIVSIEDINMLIHALANKQVKQLDEIQHTLETYFMEYYEGQ